MVSYNYLTIYYRTFMDNDKRKKGCWFFIVFTWCLQAILYIYVCFYGNGFEYMLQAAQFSISRCFLCFVSELITSWEYVHCGVMSKKPSWMNRTRGGWGGGGTETRDSHGTRMSNIKRQIFWKKYNSIVVFPPDLRLAQTSALWTKTFAAFEQTISS